jgi:glucose-6-phosphate 1-epimerase
MMRDEGTAGPSVEPGEGGLGRIILRHASGSRAEVYLHGAHVTSWRSADGVERLFLSSRSSYSANAVVRGGIPVIFPQFANQGPLPKHGFARTAEWTLASATHGDGGPAEAVLRLADSPATRAVWPHPFALELRVRLNATLSIELEVTNTDTERMDFTAALHTYLRVRDVREVVVEGLEGVRYVDKVDHGDPRVERSSHLHIASEVDRVYLDAPGDVHVRDGTGGTVVALDGFPDVVVWNPGPEKAAGIADLGPDEYRQFLCVEAAAAGQPVVLPPGGTWTASTTLRPI